MTTATPRKPGRPPKVQPEDTELAPFEIKHLHFLVDGFTAFGQVWTVGQEIEVDEAHYTETLDLKGDSWLDLSETEQVKLWGSAKFGFGPSPVPNSIIEYVEDFRGIPKKQTYSWFNTVNQDKAALAKAEVARGRSIPSL